jgi:hypothetical protein
MSEKEAPVKRRAAETMPNIDYQKPFYVVYDQTEHRRHVEVFFNRPEADRYAAERAARLGRPVAVFGPQAIVRVPRVEVLPADELALPWQGAEEEETNVQKHP